MLLLAACLGLATAVVLPIVWRVPLWLRFEAVLGAWWLVWTAIMSCLLYTGAHVNDDHAQGKTRSWFGPNDGGDKPISIGDGLLCIGFSDGCLGAMVSIVLALVITLAYWLLVEVAIPFLAFLAYLLLKAMLRRVLHDSHGCENRWGRSIRWAALWATVYVAPLAAVVWIGHLIRHPL